MNNDKLTMSQGKLFDLASNALGEASKKLSSKNDDYATDGNALYNFNFASGILGVTTERALLGFVAKQIAHLYKPEVEVNDTLKDHITDIIAYLAILYAMIEEKGDKN